MAKHKTPPPSIVAEPPATYGRIAPSSRSSFPTGGRPLPMRRFKSLAKEVPLPMDQWSRVLHVPMDRWMQRLRSSSGLQPLETDRVLLILELYRMGMGVLGGQDSMARWMAQKHFLFGKPPADLLTSQEGIERVMAELGRIEHGIPV